MTALELRASLLTSCVGYIQRPAAAGRDSFLELSRAGRIFSLRPEEEIKLNLKAVTTESAASDGRDTRGRCGKVCLLL